MKPMIRRRYPNEYCIRIWSDNALTPQFVHDFNPRMFRWLVISTVEDADVFTRHTAKKNADHIRAVLGNRVHRVDVCSWPALCQKERAV